MREENSKRELWRAEPLLGGVALFLLLIGCALVLKPFLKAVLWAMIFAYILYPLQRLFTRWFRGSRTLAAVCVALTVVLVVAGPAVWVGVSLANDGREIALATQKWATSMDSKPPGWLKKVPLVSEELESRWEGFHETRKRWMAQLDKEVKNPPPRANIVPEPDTDSPLAPEDSPEEVEPPLAAPDDLAEIALDDTGEKQEKSQLVTMLGRFLADTYQSLIAAGLAVGQGFAQVVISAFIAFFLLRDAATLSVRLGVTVNRLAGDRGKRLIQVAAGTVRSVIFGILGTALAQGVVAWVGFWFAGVPGAVLLAVLTFVFAVLPFGPPLVWLPASLWLFANDQPAMGVFMLLWGGIAISSVDNILRPLLISQGSKMPFVLIFCGVIGGVIAFGVVGIFLGPTLLAVAYRLIDEWSSVDESEEREAVSLISELQESVDSPTSAAHGS